MAVEPQIDVCIVGDDSDQRRLLARQVQSSGYSLADAVDGEQGLALIRKHRPRVVLCDLLMPKLNGIDLCRQLRGDADVAGPYIIMLSACSDLRSKTDALAAGADDYMVKPYDINELGARLSNGMRISRLQERLRLAAITDGLTGLANYSEFRETLGREFTRTRRYGGMVSLLMLDIDHFKAVNDAYGHEVGNTLLQHVAKSMQRLVRETDFVARYGGEEFAVVLPQTALDDAARLAERMRQTLAVGVRLQSLPELTITASIGVACSNDPRAHSVGDLVNLADGALYVAKHGGRNRVIRADTLSEPTPAPGIRADDVERLRKQVVSLSMQAKEMCLQTVWAFVQAIEARDPYAAHHSRNVTQYATDMASAAGWSVGQRQALANAAMLHELGKIGVPDQLLRERGPLSPVDSALLRQVPTLTCKVLEPLRMFESEIIIIRYMRERWDGAGYPYGLAGANIPIGSRLLAVAETIDALTNDRPHRPSRTLDEAIKTIQDESGKQFDPHFAELLARVALEHRSDWQARIDSTLRSLRSAASAVENASI